MIWWALLSAGVWLAERLPARPLYVLGRIAARLLVWMPTAPRNRLRRNLSRASGRSLSDPALDALVRSAYETQVANYIDLVRSRRISDAEVARTFSPAGPAWGALVEAVREKRGAVLVTAHFGRIELLNHFLAQFRLPTTLPIERLRPPPLFELVRGLRAQKGVDLVPHDAGLRPCLRALGRGDVVALFAEWDPTGHGVPVRFFGSEAQFPPGPAFLALRSGAPLFVGVELPGERPGTLQGYLEAPLEVVRTGEVDGDVQRTTQLIALAFERHIASHPERWVMFHDIWAGESTGVSQSGATAG